MTGLVPISGIHRSKIVKTTLNALRTRQSLVKGERLVRHEMRAVLTLKLLGATRIAKVRILFGHTQHLG